MATLKVLVLGSFAIGACLAYTLPDYWVGELLTHFQRQFALVLVTSLSVALLTRRAIGFWLLLVPTALSVHMVLQQAQTPTLTQASSEAGASLSLVLFNVLKDSHNQGEVMRFLQEQQSDIVALVETGDDWNASFAATNGTYPFQFTHDPGDGWGLSVLSRTPLQHTQAFNLGGMPALSAVFHTERGPCTLYVIHLKVPASPAARRLRNQQGAELAARMQAAGDECSLVAGDFNLSPLSPDFPDLQGKLGLVAAAASSLSRYTWPSFMPLLGIVIDHVFVPASWRRLHEAVGPSFGSDHRALSMRFVLP